MLKQELAWIQVGAEREALQKELAQPQKDKTKQDTMETQTQQGTVETQMEAPAWQDTMETQMKYQTLQDTVRTQNPKFNRVPWGLRLDYPLNKLMSGLRQDHSKN